MTPSLYDLLDVDESASTEEIRAAWKAAIADLDPTDRRFRAYNQAAETLLDPQRRAAYDAEMAGQEPEAEEAPEPEPEPEAAVERAPEPEPEPEAVPAEPEPTPEPEPGVSWTARTVPLRQLVIAAVVTVVALAATVVYVWNAADTADDLDRIDDREQAAQQAETVAEEAVGPVLSYDYRSLEDDIARATPYLTDGYADDYRGLMDDLAPQAAEGKIVVSAESIATGLIRSGDDRAEVLVFVNQDSSRDGAEAAQLRMWVTLTMVHEGDRWLVDDMKVDTVLPG